MELPNQGRLAGIDFGTVRIGLATCDPSQQWVTPYDTYQTRNTKLDAAFFEQLADREELCGWVIGLPIHCDGKESQKSAEVRDFAIWLQRVTGLPYAFYDERFSTREAKRLLAGSGLGNKRKKQRLDRLAAHLILSHYLDFRRNQSQYGLGDSPALRALED
jgi:putative Holliday junction resolvase